MPHHAGQDEVAEDAPSLGQLKKSLIIDLFTYVCKLPIVDHVMLSREFFLYVSENYSFIFTRICLNLKEIILKGTITWSTLGQQTNEAKEVYSLGGRILNEILRMPLSEITARKDSFTAV